MPIPKRGEIASFRIESLAFGGKGIARVTTPEYESGYVVFIPNTIPGQLVQARIVKKRKRHAEAKLLSIVERSEQEQAIPYQSIPGAPYATWPMEAQHAHKRESTIELFKRIGGQPEIEAKLGTFIGSPASWHYRNKMEYSFPAVQYDLQTDGEIDTFALGFKHRGQWLSVENMDADSGLFDAAIENSLHEVRTWCKETGLPPWHPARHSGFFRYLTIRKSISEDTLLVNLTTHNEGLEKFDREAFIALIRKLWGERVTGILHTINDSSGDRMIDERSDVQLIYGSPTLRDEILGLSFEMSIQSFFQPNPRAAALLYQKALDYVFEDMENEQGVVMDLFCGTGTIGQILAQRTAGKRPVIGVDIVESAIVNAQENAKRNNLEGLSFYAADVGKFLREYPDYQGRIHTVVLDPPRGGIAPKTLRRIIELGAQRIVYVSCNPATQARDTVELTEAGYTLQKLSLVDQFPHTAHVETVALFDR